MHNKRSSTVGRRRRMYFVTAFVAATIGLATTALTAPTPVRPVPFELSTARLMGVDMVTATIAYADGYQNGHFVLWRTNDGWSTWAEYAVAGSPLAKNPKTTTPTVSFLSPNIGWIAWIVPNQNSSTLTVLRTTTGGRVWDRSVIHIARAMSMVEQVDFTSANDGWIRAFSGGAMMQGDTDIFRTTNQGASWTLVSAAGGYVPNPHPTSNALPALDEPMPMTFTSPDAGWVAVGNLVVSTASASLYHTTDSGARWLQIALPVPKADDRDSTIGFTPAFSGMQGTVLMQYQGKSNHLIVYGTANGGSSWTIKSELALDRSQFAWQTSFANPEHGWIIDDAATRFEETADGGRTWAELPIAGILRSAAQRGYRVVTLQMITKTSGSLLLQQVNGVTSATKSLLLHTTDGGATWEPTLAAHGVWPS